MATRMLIDARHREETRVAVVENNRIEEFDFESAEHKQLKGNIYLAKVTRVEPSLQAAFIDYGGNRHGFLAFSEIHPDYYQIPESDRQALLAEEAASAREEAELRDDADDAAAARDGDDDRDGEQPEEFEPVYPDKDAVGEEDEPPEIDEPDEIGPVAGEEPSIEDIRRRRMNLRRRYKIQDVIHRRQLLLVQVVKEERGNKGAALTTYLSLAGRYCVLMPNTSHGGGISRKISNAADRKRLKSIVAEFRLPDTMGCIVRTAGMTRTRIEIKRDFTYLARLWDEIRENTLGATAPARIHTDSDLVKRAIRDIYHREIEEVIVEGEDGYKAARDFMKLLMPSHARRVKHYADPTPLYQRYHVEDQLSAMYHPLVQLKSGGYLVINPTEALVSIDINSGRSTREYNIEQTALKTNIEAAREIARQLRLRDMAGLIVIDFIDMDHNSNNRKVEKAIKDALKNDRARIQVGRISSFGLLEMSRQRLRTGVLEASTMACRHCEGTGLMRTASSAGLSALRMIEEEAAKGRGSQLTLRCGEEAAVYLLNAKRGELVEIEERYGVRIAVIPDDKLEGAAMSCEAAGPPPERRFELAPLALDEVDDEPEEIDLDEEEDEDESIDDGRNERPRAQADRDDGSKRRSRRGGRGRGRRDAPREVEAEATTEGDDAPIEPIAQATDPDAEGTPRRSRRGRRGGRRRRAEGDEAATEGSIEAPFEAGEPSDEPGAAFADEVDAPIEGAVAGALIAQAEAPSEATSEADAPARPATRRRPRARAAAGKPEVEVEAADAPVESVAIEADAPARPARARRARTAPAAPVESAANDAEPPGTAANDAVVDAAETAPSPRPRRSRKAASAPGEAEPAAAEPVVSEQAAAENSDSEPESDDATEPRRGWWQRTFGT